VRLKQIILAPKSGIDIGKKWTSGKVPRAEFPMAKAAYRLGQSFKWTTIKFQALGSECRVLVVMNPAKQKYDAILGVMGANGALRILCSYEYHATEPGWHCHATHDDSASLSGGCMRGPWVKRVPAARGLHRATKHAKFAIGDEAAAIRFALARYKIEEKGTLL
jgi:hypothetical protein